MPTAAATNEIFPDVEQTIRNTARRFARRYNRDEENVLSEAFELFISAHREKYDRTRSPSFERFLKSFLWNRLLDKTRQYAQRAAKMPLDRSALSRGVADRRPRFDRDRLEDCLSADAREVLAAVLDGPGDMPTEPVAVRGWLREVLAARGFEPGQVTAAFREIRGAL